LREEIVIATTQPVDRWPLADSFFPFLLSFLSLLFLLVRLLETPFEIHANHLPTLLRLFWKEETFQDDNDITSFSTTSNQRDLKENPARSSCNDEIDNQFIL